MIVDRILSFGNRCKAITSFHLPGKLVVKVEKTVTQSVDKLDRTASFDFNLEDTTLCSIIDLNFEFASGTAEDDESFVRDNIAFALGTLSSCHSLVLGPTSRTHELSSTTLSGRERNFLGAKNDSRLADQPEIVRIARKRVVADGIGSRIEVKGYVLALDGHGRRQSSRPRLVCRIGADPTVVMLGLATLRDRDGQPTQ